MKCPTPPTTGRNVGHGHVFPRPDGVRARCGGPPICTECAIDAASKALGATASGEPPPPTAGQQPAVQCDPPCPVHICAQMTPAGMCAAPQEQPAAQVREPRTHELKVWPEFFATLADGSKTFEVRKDDRGFRVGDRLFLNEWIPHEGGGGEYTSGQLCKVITYILAGPAFGVARDFVVMGLADPEPDEFSKYLHNHDLTQQLAAANAELSAYRMTKPGSELDAEVWHQLHQKLSAALPNADAYTRADSFMAADALRTRAETAEAKLAAANERIAQLTGARIRELEARGAEAVDILGDVRMYHGTREQLAVYDNEDWIARRDAFLSRATAQQPLPAALQEPPRGERRDG